MGVTIHYRGALDDPNRIEDFEDRVLELAIEINADAQIFRAMATNDRNRMLRGLRMNVAPGQDTLSLVISPEGWIIGFPDFDAACEGQLTESPWCFVKTQFGPIEAHVAVIELLRAIKNEFASNLEVIDEGNYWGTRDFAALTEKFAFLRGQIRALSVGIQRYGLSEEACQDPEILAHRIERIASKIHEDLARPATLSPIHNEDSFEDFDSRDDGLDADDAVRKTLYNRNRRTQERMIRRIRERMALGDSAEQAWDAALRELVLHEGTTGATETELTHADEDFTDVDGDEPLGKSNETAWDEFEASLGRHERDRHPLLDQVSDLVVTLHRLTPQGDGLDSGFWDALHRGSVELAGGLAQALCSPCEAALGLNHIQFKRALRGAALAVGALYPLNECHALSDSAYEELRASLTRFQQEIYAELKKLNSRRM